jgi:hypothetical protein
LATSETLFVGAAKKGALIEASSAIQAKHLVLHGKAIGEGEARPSPIEVEEFCILTSVTNRSIQAGHILVGGDAQFSKLNAEHDIRIGGALRGGVTQCRQDLQVFGDLGTEAGGSNTTVLLPAEGGVSVRQKKMVAALRQYKTQLEQIHDAESELKGRSEKRSKVDQYWAKLAEGERQPPNGPLQINTFPSVRRVSRAEAKAVRRLGAKNQTKEGEDKGGGQRPPSWLAVPSSLMSVSKFNAK